MGNSLSSRRIGRNRHSENHHHDQANNSNTNNIETNGNHSNRIANSDSSNISSIPNGEGFGVSIANGNGNGDITGLHAGEHPGVVVPLYPHENGNALPGHGFTQNPPAGYLPYLYPPVNYPQGYIQSSGHFVINITQPPIVLPENSVPMLPPPELIENPRGNTIMHDVNLKKNTLRLEEDKEKPGSYLVAFSYDAIASGWVSIFFVAKEGQQCSLSAIYPEIYMPVRIPFEKGMDQHFKQAPGTGVNLTSFAESDLVNEGPGEIYPLIVRTETISKDPPPDAWSRDEEPIDSPLPKWVHAQMTHALLEKKEDGYSAKVVKQIIYVDGIRYELQEIYGIENADGSVGVDGNDVGKECVICLSELRDTTVLPCRHMCMCSGCAKVLRFQSNRCPICRTPVERLLEIKVSKKEEDHSKCEEPSHSKSEAESHSKSEEQPQV